jgi:hypothetical protein
MSAMPRIPSRAEVGSRRRVAGTDKMPRHASQGLTDPPSLERRLVLDPPIGSSRALADGTDPHSHARRGDSSRRMAAFLPSARPDRHPMSLVRTHDGMCLAGARADFPSMAQQYSKPAADVHQSRAGRIPGRRSDGRGPHHSAGSRRACAKDTLDSCRLRSHLLLDCQSLPVRRDSSVRRTASRWVPAQ